MAPRAPTCEPAEAATAVLGSRCSSGFAAAGAVTIRRALRRHPSQRLAAALGRRICGSRCNQASWQNDISLRSDRLPTAGFPRQQEQISGAIGYLASARGDAGSAAPYQRAFCQNEIALFARRRHNGRFNQAGRGW